MYYNYNFMCMIIIFFIYFIYYLIFNFSFQFYMTLNRLRQKPRIQSTIHIPSTCVYILRICLPFQTLQLKDSVLICTAISMSQWNFWIITRYTERFCKLFYLRERTSNGNCNYDLSLIVYDFMYLLDLVILLCRHNDNCKTFTFLDLRLFIMIIYLFKFKFIKITLFQN